MQLSVSSSNLLSNFRQRIVVESGDVHAGRDFDPGTLTIIATLLSSVLGPLLALCNKTPPKPTPVPTPLAEQGVSQDTWEKASEMHWGAGEAWNDKKKRYHAAAVNKAAAAIAEHDNTKKKLSRPAATAAFDTAHLETPEDIALLMHETNVT